LQKRQHARGPWLAAFLSLAVVLTCAIATGANAGKNQSQGPCASIDRFQLEKQMNSRASQILAACGRAPGKSSAPEKSSFSALDRLTPSSPDVYGGPDKNLISGGPETFPNVTQSEVQAWANGNTVMAAYNDSTGRNASPVCIAGGSRSTDGGTTWANIHPFCAAPGGRGNFGDPAIVYDAMHSVWVAVFLASGGSPNCGTQGIGVWRSTDNGATWTVGNCAHVNSQDDRESMWVDNAPASPFYGRIYVTWNDFNVGGGALYSTYSTDGGVTWSAPVQVLASFRRDVQVTTDPDGDVFIAAMDEGGGGLAGPRTNYVYPRRTAAPRGRGSRWGRRS